MEGQNCVSRRNRKNRFLKLGINIGYQHYKVVEDQQKRNYIQYYKCQEFGHVATDCKQECRCRKCGEGHEEKECNTEKLKCANCKEEHKSSDPVCTVLLREAINKDAQDLSYAAMVKKGGDKVECARLACCIATSVSSVLIKRAKISVNISDICRDVAENVARFYKTSIRGEHVYNMAFQRASKTSEQVIDTQN